MNTKKVLVYGLLAVILALSLTGCIPEPDPEPDPVTDPPHTHSYGTAWSFDTTQHWHECTANDGTKSDVANHTGSTCSDCGYDSTATLVTFSNVTANGNATTTTTTLMLTFSQAIAGLTANDINLSGVAGVQRGALSGTGPTYTLGISGFTAGGTLSVAVSKIGYNISGSPKSTAIYYYTSSGGGGDLQKWTAVADSPFGTTLINAIAYGNNIFVAGGVDGKMAYSTDGISWTAVADSTFDTSWINAIAYGNNKFVAVGTDMSLDTLFGGKMAYSTDGMNWTAVADSTFGTSSIAAIAYGNNKFVAVGADTSIVDTQITSSGKMAYSSDGINWTAVADSTFASGINAIAYGNNKFVAVGADISSIVDMQITSSSKMAYSSDGINWTAVADSTFGTTPINHIAYGNNMFVAGGTDISSIVDMQITSSGKMAYSSDGINWTAVADSTFGTTQIRDIAYGNGRFVVAGGWDGKMAYSSDGASWTAVADTTFGTSLINAIAYGNNKFVAVGGDFFTTVDVDMPQITYSGKIAYADW